jgi:hypothetical protein
VQQQHRQCHQLLLLLLLLLLPLVWPWHVCAGVVSTWRGSAAV